MIAIKPPKSWASLFTQSKRDALYAFTAKITGTAFGLLFNIALARMLGPAGTGVYFLALTVISIGATVARLGLDMASLRFAAIAFKQKNTESLASIYRQSFCLVLAMCVLTTLVIYIVIPYLPLGTDNSAELQETLHVILFSLFPLAFIRVQGQFYKAIGEPWKAIFIQTALLHMFMLSCVLYYISKDSDITVTDIAYAYVLASALTLLIPVAFWLRRFPQILYSHIRFDTQELVRTSLPLLWISSMGLIFSWTDTLVLGYWTDTGTVGVYGIASRIAALAAFVLLAVNSVTAPRFAAMHAQDNIKGMEKMAQTSVKWMIIVVTPIIALLIIAPELILGLFGEAFEDGSSALRILAIGQLINVAVGTVGSLLMMSGHGTVVRNNTVFAVSLNLIGNLALVPLYGATGAAISTSVSVILQNIILYWKVKKILGISTLPSLRSSGSR